MSDSLTLTGQTLVIDHGQSVVSVFFHLGRIEVGTGQTVARGTRLGLSGESGLAERPHLHWGVYVSGVAIDPRVMERVDP
jgi:murein DD-endopeptidase MepM/ murein hydrolase activator NlpD